MYKHFLVLIVFVSLQLREYNAFDICNTFKHSTSTLSSLIVIQRHGDRTPVISYPTDPYTCYWKQGYGVLAEKGIQRMKDTGRIFREKYESFLPEKSMVKVRSSNSDRVIKSAQAFLEGLYLDSFVKNPIPIDVIFPPSDDKVVSTSTDQCPRYVQELERVYNLPQNMKWIDDFEPLRSYLYHHSGFPIKNKTGAEKTEIINLIDTFLVQKNFNLTPPEWLTDTIFNQLLQAACKQIQLYYSTQLQISISAGLLFKEIQNQMQAIESRRTFDKIRIYSTHDFKLAAILSGLNAFNGLLPPYGASIVFEIHSKRESIRKSENFIKAFFLNDTTTAIFHPLNIPGCNQKYECSFETIYKLIDNFIPTDWYKLCQL